MIQLFDAHQDYRHFANQINQAVQRVLESGWYILGDELATFEKQFAAYTGTKYAVGVANGLDALQLSLRALDIGPGDEVITCGHSFIATALPIASVGATPVFVDMDEYYHLDVAQVEAAITPKTKAILPVHLYGQLCDINAILEIAQRHNLKVIEDACQAHGASLNGRQAGSFGDFGCFSFYPTKNLGAFGDAGAIVTDDEKLYQRLLLLRNYGQKVKYVHQEVGQNSRMDELQAALLSVKLPELDQSVKRRQELAELYFAELSSCKALQLPKVRSTEQHAYHLFVIATDKRDKLAEYLKQHDIQTLVHYPVPIHKQAAFQEFNSLSLPATEQAAKQVLSLPLHQYLSNEDVKVVCQHIRNFFG